MALDLVNFVHAQAKGPKVAIVTASLVSGFSRGMVLATINTAAAQAVDGRVEWVVVLTFFGVVLTHLATDYYSRLRTNEVVRNMVHRLRVDACQKILRTELRFVEGHGRGEIFARLTGDIWSVSRFAEVMLGTMERSVLLIFCLVYLGTLSVLGLVATLVTIMAGAGVYLRQERVATENLQMAREKEAEFYDGSAGLLDGFKELKIHRPKMNAAVDDVRKISAESRIVGLKTDSMFLLSDLTARTFTFVLLAMVVFVLPATVTAQGVTVFQFVAAILFMLGPFEGLITSIPSLFGARVALRNLQRFDAGIEASMVRQGDREANVEPLSFTQIRLHQVRFEYGNSTTNASFAVGPVDLELNRGDVLFIVGGNGSGKTTLLKLLVGLYAPHCGEILVDGQALSGAGYQAYREMFTTVFGDFHLFRKLYGTPVPDLVDLNAILRRLDLDKKTRFKDGAFTTIDLSTGQRKRLAYVVSHLEDRKVYLFDEFGAEQDPEFRHFFYHTLIPELKARGKTVIAVTHDDRYFGLCDRLVKMDYGRIVDER